MSKSERYVVYHGLSTQKELFNQLKTIQTTMLKTLENPALVDEVKEWGRMMEHMYSGIETRQKAAM